MLTIIISILTAILLILVGILFLTLTKAKKRNKELENNQIEINQQKHLLEKANAELTNARNEAEKNNAFKSDFLANVGHELRTPLNAIIGYAKLMHNNNIDIVNTKYLDNIIQASDNLVVIIGELLDFSKIEAGKMLVDKTPFNPVNIVTETISTLRVYAEEKSNPIEIHIDPNMPQYVLGDQKHLAHILTNIISNAIKFSHLNKPISIEAQCSQEGNNCLLTFIVTDLGIGIEESQQAVIFESFTQAKNNTNKKYSGTGLGLAIVKRLVELQEGTITLKSEPKKGTTFTIQIPYIITKKADDKNKKTMKGSDMTKTSTENIEILLVEDNEINQELAKDTILSWGDNYKVTIAENGKEAIEILNINNFDVILMDIQMPEMDGHEATCFIRNNMDKNKSKIPIIGMTAHAMQSEKDLALKNGMNDYIIKPFDPDKLKNIINNSISK